MVYRARQGKARQRNATSRKPKRKRVRERKVGESVREMREGEKMEPQRRNRLLDEAAAGIPTNRKTTDGGSIMGDSGRVWTRGAACSAAE